MCTAEDICHAMQHNCSSVMLLELVLPLSCLGSVEHMEGGSKLISREAFRTDLRKLTGGFHKCGYPHSWQLDGLFHGKSDL